MSSSSLAPRLPGGATIARDARASLVVFLVALPLCLGVAIASGVPPALGIITGIVGGLVVGLLPGSRLQVSGPAAGLTVLIFGAVEQHGLAVLGPIVIAAGALQLVLAAARLGQWFRAMALPVVHGMLAGIGLLIIASQALVLVEADATGSGPGDLAALPGAFWSALTGPGGVEHALMAGALALAVLIAWPRMPERARAVPAPLVAVVLATLGTAALSLDAERISLPSNLADAITLPSGDTFTTLTDPTVLGIAIALGLVASAESLLSAVAVDRMHNGEPTRFNRELAAQGVGNTVAGVLGALPMTAVIVRSAANVEAGAQTRASRVLHGVWLLLFAVALPGVLSLVPTAALAAVLIVAGVALLKPANVKRIARDGRGDLAVYAATVAGVFVLGLLEGVLLGLVLAGAMLLKRMTAMRVRREDDRVVVEGPATFLAVPRLASELEDVPAGHDVRVDLSASAHVDPAARDLLDGWRERHEATGARVTIEG